MIKFICLIKSIRFEFLASHSVQCLVIGCLSSPFEGRPWARFFSNNAGRGLATSSDSKHPVLCTILSMVFCLPPLKGGLRPPFFLMQCWLGACHVISFLTSYSMQSFVPECLSSPFEGWPSATLLFNTMLAGGLCCHLIPNFVFGALFCPWVLLFTL